jgi:hypothetical protein
VPPTFAGMNDDAIWRQRRQRRRCSRLAIGANLEDERGAGATILRNFSSAIRLNTFT